MSVTLTSSALATVTVHSQNRSMPRPVWERKLPLPRFWPTITSAGWGAAVGSSNRGSGVGVGVGTGVGTGVGAGVALGAT